MGSRDRQRSEGRATTKRSWYGAPRKGSRYGPTTARKRWPGWTTSYAPRRAAIRSCAESGRGWEIAQNAKPGPKAVRADLLHEAGAHAVQELGYGIAAGVERLVELTDIAAGGHGGARDRVCLRGGAGYFVEIAKLRAARMLWAQAVSAFGPRDDGACRMRLHVRTPRRNKSAYDRYTNLLRVTTEAFAAAVGGCDQLDGRAVRVRCAPGVERAAHPEGRIASGCGGDPAGGSYYIEALTDSLAREAWKLFQQMEAEGGYAKALASGSIDKALAETRAARGRRHIPRAGARWSA